MVMVLVVSCGFQSSPSAARLILSSGQPCADKVALADNSGQPVDGAWACLNPSAQDVLRGFGVKNDSDMAHWLNPDKYMETVKFVGRTTLYGPAAADDWFLFRVEGHPTGAQITGYTEIEVDLGTGLVAKHDTTYCKPQGDLICKGLPT
jgi:hypothetical protein